MRLLPKKQDIDKAKASERKQEIDSGLALAKSVDKLREQLALEKKNLTEWRTNNIAKIQQEIDDYLGVKESLRIETEKQEKYRKELIEPLDKEWAEVNKTKAQNIKDKETIYLSGEQLKEKELKIEVERKKVSQIVSQVIQNEKDIEKAKDEAKSLKELAQREHEIAREEHRLQTESFEKVLSEVHKREEEYRVALRTIETREKEVEQKENQLLLDKQHLESQQRALRIAKEEINNYERI